VIGVTAGWHSLRRSCLTRKLVRSHLKNKLRRKPQYPNAGILAVHGGEDVNGGAVIFLSWQLLAL